MFEVVEVTLQGVGYAMFNISFVFGILYVFLINRKLNELDFYRAVKKKRYLYLMSDIVLQGVVAGIVVSVTMVVVGVPLYFNDVLLLLIPICFILGVIRMRLLCISYAAGIIGMVSLSFYGQTLFGRTMPSMEVHVPSLLILVGLIHLVEGILLLVSKGGRAVPVLSKKKDKVIMGHIIQRTWIIPLGVLALQIGIMGSGGVKMPDWWPMIEYSGYGEDIYFAMLPLLGVMSYSSITYVESPEERSRKTGFYNVIFSLVIIALGSVSVNSRFLQIVGVLLMMGLHEFIYYLEKNNEDRKLPIYEVPEKGVRIMEVIDGGFASISGIIKGDVVTKVNDQDIVSITEFVKTLQGKKLPMTLDLCGIDGITKTVEVKESKEIDTIGIRLVPEKPVILYPYDKFSHQGIYDFLKREY